MNFEDLLNGFLKMPKTKEEAKAYIKKFPSMRASVEDMAFRQTVINVLILSGAVTENDLNASIKHFEDQLYEEFATELLNMVDELEKAADKAEIDEEQVEEDDWEDDKHHCDA